MDVLGTASCLALVDTGGRALELMLEVSLERGTRAGRRGKAKCLTGQHVNKSRAYSGKLRVVSGPQRGLLRWVCSVSFQLDCSPHRARSSLEALPPSATRIFLDR